MNTILASSLPTKKYVDPDSISVPFHDIAQQNVSLLLKNESSWVLKQSVGQIGWRIRKHYFKVVHKCSNQKQSQSKLESQPSTSSYKENSEQEYILSWTEFGPDKHISEKEMNAILKSLTKIKHPFICDDIEFIQCNENGCLVIRKFHKEGSLKDFIVGAKSPLNSFSSKYGNAKGRKALSPTDLALYGRQILEALQYLHAEKLPYGHLSTSNVFIENGIAKLSALENFIIGVHSFYRPFLVQHSKINSMELIDVFTFGHFLFESMSTYSLQEPFVREINDCPPSLKSLLELIISKESLKSSAPPLDQILKHAFFKEFAPSFDEKYAELLTSARPKLELPVDPVMKTRQKTEQRLKEEQKLVKSQKRVTQSQKMMITEEEKRKQTKQKQLKAQGSIPTEGYLEKSNTNSRKNGPISFKISISEDDPSNTH